MDAPPCKCRCHGASDGVPADDAIACVTACDRCIDRHWPYILGFDPPAQELELDPPPSNWDGDDPGDSDVTGGA